MYAAGWHEGTHVGRCPRPRLRDRRPGVWEFGREEGDPSGLLSTAGGLVFGAIGQDFFVLDALNGESLGRFNLGANVVAAPVSYAS